MTDTYRSVSKPLRLTQETLPVIPENRTCSRTFWHRRIGIRSDIEMRSMGLMITETQPEEGEDKLHTDYDWSRE
ncbi:Hypothetical predicted protein [Scomber scombrus]|uniref:Uncharacterized protein n=1 Tax=Scomber scombrus TaxID=13677 RepID=A0AAV1NKL1_SCOSC